VDDGDRLPHPGPDTDTAGSDPPDHDSALDSDALDSDALDSDALDSDALAVAPALFVPEGPSWRPTELSRGPWSPDALHGGPVAALVARAVDRCPSPTPSMVTRITLELVKPVPLAPLTVVAAVVRPGRRIQIVDVRIEADGVDVAWARAVRIRTLPVGSDVPRTPGPVPGVNADAPALPERGTPPMRMFSTQLPAFHNRAVDMRFVRGRFDVGGPSQVWVRLRVPVVPGETPTPLQRVAAAADFGNGVSAELPFEQFVFVNPDLTIHLARMPDGAWVGLDSSTRLGTPGTGLAQSVLWDRGGPFGRALQGLYVDPRH
jgi:hypothetical protein